MSSDPPAPDEQARALFQQAIGETTPLQHDRAEPFRRRLPARPLPPPAWLREKQDDPFVDMAIETGDELEFVRPGVQRRLFADLRRGHLRPQDSLDLHGLRVVEARTALARFLDHARHHRLRVLHIIHGKGYGSHAQQPILKQKVNQWLRQPEDVLAFCSAPRFDGGLGAVYLLLGRKRNDK